MSDQEAVEFQDVLVMSGEGLVRFIYLLVITVGIVVGNALVIVAVGKFKKLRKTTNIMLASLAVADLMVGLVTVPLYIAWTMHPDVFNRSPFLCRTALLSSLLVVAASQLNLLLLSAERYLAVCAPFRHRTILISCPWLHVVVICITWTASLMTTGLASLAIKSDYTVCNYYKTFNRWFLFFAVIFGVFIPFIAIICMNIKVFLSVLKHEMRRKYFVGEGSDSVRPVSDSSDQEIRVPLYENANKNSDSYRQSTVKDYIFACFPSLKTRCTSEHESLGNDSVFEKVETHETNDTRELKFSTQALSLSEGGEKIATADCNIAPFHKEFQDDYEQTRDHIGEQSSQEHSGTKSTAKLHITEGSTYCERLPSCNIDKEHSGRCHDDNQAGDSNSSYTGRQSHLTECNVSSVAPQAEDTDLPNACHMKLCFFSADNLLHLDPDRYSDNGVKRCASKPGQLSFHRKIYTKVETFATPRILRKPLLLDASFGDVLSSRASHSNGKIMTSNLEKSCDTTTIEHLLKSMTFSEIETQGETQSPRRLNYMRRKGERGYLSIPLLPQTNEGTETGSLKNIGYSSAHKEQRAKSTNIGPGVRTRKLPISTTGTQHLMLAKNCGTTERWLSDALLNESRLNKTSDPRSAVSEKLIGSTAKHPLKSSSITPLVSHQTASTEQHALSHTLFHFKDNSTIRFNGFQRGSSVPVFNLPSSETSAEKPQIRKKTSFARRPSDPFLPGRRTSLSQEKPRQMSRVSQVEGFWSRKLSSVREIASSQSAYVSKKVARTVALVCFSFILAWLPFFAVIIMNTFCVKCDLVYFLNVVLMITFAQSATNPIIYALCHASFRTAYKNLFRQMCLK